jgi:tRNA A-37 threonylcarbamoyl transferase component Bud32
MLRNSVTLQGGPLTTQQLGRYQLLQRLAVGGMAEIYLGRVQGISGFEKLIVLKRILPQHALDPQRLRMFLDEARLMATLTHPQVTQVYDVGTSGDVPFFCMEYVHGANLREILDAAGGNDGQTALPLAHAVGIVAAAAAGLHYAHEKTGPTGDPLGIVHRDVSPSNVLVTYDGSVKVSDFGIAKWASQRSETQDGTLKGKLAYMSPEQCRGQAVDRRSDVFALGTLLYELTTGVHPFASGDGSDYQLLTQIVNHPPAPPRLPSGAYPPELERIVMRALARDPGDRYPTAEALQLDLETFAREQKLVVSAVALGAYMRSLFAERLVAWQQAQNEGKSLGEHLTEAGAAQLATPTLTDAFAAPVRSPTQQRATAVAGLIAGAALLVAAGTMAALKLRGTPGTDDRNGGAGESTVTATPTAARPISQPVTRVETAPAPGPVADAAISTGTGAALTVKDHPSSPAQASARPKRLGRQRPTAAPVPPPDNTAPVKAWDPDSPVPP